MTIESVAPGARAAVAKILETGLRRVSEMDAEHYNQDDHLGAAVNRAVLVSNVAYGLPGGLALLANWFAEGAKSPSDDAAEQTEGARLGGLLAMEELDMSNNLLSKIGPTAKFGAVGLLVLSTALRKLTCASATGRARCPAREIALVKRGREGAAGQGMRGAHGLCIRHGVARGQEPRGSGSRRIFVMQRRGGAEA